MHIAIDFDDTLYDLSTQLAAAISKSVGYEVLPAAVCSSDWAHYYGVDPEAVLEHIDKHEPKAKLLPGAAAFLRELLFCGHHVTVVTARRSEFRLAQVRSALHWAGLSKQGIAIVSSPTEHRAHDVRNIGADVLIDDRAASCYAAAARGIASVRFGEKDVLGAHLQEKLRSHHVAMPTYASDYSDLRLVLRSCFNLKLLPQTIGLIGKARAGKDTVGAIIRQLGFGYQLFSYAAALKELARALLTPNALAAFCFRYSNEDTVTVFSKLTSLYEGATLQDIVDKTERGRTILQYLGTEVVRECIGEWWLELLGTRVAKTFNNADQRATITDVRYLHEANAIKDGGGLLVHVVREASGLQGETAKHSSEKLEALKVDANVVSLPNNGTIEDLKKSVELVLKDAVH